MTLFLRNKCLTFSLFFLFFLHPSLSFGGLSESLNQFYEKGKQSNWDSNTVRSSYSDEFRSTSQAMIEKTSKDYKRAAEVLVKNNPQYLNGTTSKSSPKAEQAVATPTVKTITRKREILDTTMSAGSEGGAQEVTFGRPSSEKSK